MLKLKILLSISLFVSASYAQYGEGKEKKQFIESREKILTLLLKYYWSVNRQQKTGNKLTIMSFNILSPIRIDRTELAENGVDAKLLRTDLRMYVIAKRVLKFNADIVHIQELQDDTYETLKNYIKDDYDATSFAPHGPNHWPDLPPGMENRPNGGAIFYKKDKFWKHEETPIETGRGNVAQAAVLQRIAKISNLSRPKPLIGPPILSVNIHFQHGIGVNDSILRVRQGGAVREKIDSLKEKVRQKFPGQEPIVVVGGDFNSLVSFPGVQSFQTDGYTNARVVTNNSDNSIYYPSLLVTQFFPPLEGLPIDTFFVPNSLVEDGYVNITQLEVSDINSDDISEYGFVTRVLGYLSNDMRDGKVDRNMSSTMLAVLQEMLSDESEYDTLFNRAMRMGSDHISLVVTLQISNPE